MKIIDIEGIGPAYAKKLGKAGLKTVEGLLKAGASPNGRKEIAEKSGIDGTMILEWVNRADLMRIKGIGNTYADLLKKAGIDTIRELAERDPKQLLENINGLPFIGKRLSIGLVTRWTGQASRLAGDISIPTPPPPKP